MYEELYAENRGLLVTLARRYARLCELDRAVSEEDLIQAGFIGLARAARTYDPAAGKSWGAWAVWHIRREIHRALGLREGRFVRAHTGADTLDRRPSNADGTGETLLDRLADESLPEPDEALLRDELRRGVREAVDRLRSEDQRRVTRLTQLEGRSYREAAAELGVSVQRAQSLWRQAGENLCRDGRLRQLADLDERTRFHAYKSFAAFNRDWTSVTEGTALWRIGQEEQF